jgi:hypothetical protein
MPPMKTAFRQKPPPARVPGVTLFMYRSDSDPAINAIVAREDSTGLPAKYGPWTAAGTTLPGRALPHGLSRKAADDLIKQQGFALWRMKQSDSSN